MKKRWKKKDKIIGSNKRMKQIWDINDKIKNKEEDKNNADSNTNSE